MQFKKTVLENGLRIITAPQPGNLAVTLLVLVEAGSKYESKENRGISHFLEHMCFKGTAKRPKAIQIAEELDSIGSSYNAFTGMEYTGYYAKAEARNFDKILDLISDLYLNPTFDPAEIDKERGVIIEEINMYEDDSPNKVQEIFLELLYGDQPAGWDITGPKDNILKLTQKDFTDYREAHYLASATTVVVAGAFDESETIEKIKETFKDIKAGDKGAKIKTAESQDKPNIVLRYKESDQTHIVLGVRAYDLFHKDRFALEILAHILGGGMSSRLFEKLRNVLGAAYYVSAGADLYTDHGYMAVSAGIDKNKITEVINGILAEFRSLRDVPVSETELEKVKNHLSGGIILGLETSNKLASFYGGQEIIEKHVLTPEEIIKKLNEVTSEDIMEVAKDIFKPEKLNLAVLGPLKDKEALERLLTL